ncbi:MAG: tryptophan synthase subunit alpha [Blastocatellia bacterium]|nr:tryptophan synthase subunit alpha [Blastocatellia bacterium]
MPTLSAAFASARDRGRGALIPYIPAGFPSLDATVEIAVALANAGADVLELGVPFSDPVADGPVIQRASEMALAAGTTLAGCLEVATRIGQRSPIPIVLFSYYNPLLQFGLDRLAEQLAIAGVAGLLVTDVVPEESAPLTSAMGPCGIDTVFLAAPTSSDARLARIAAVSRGFVYSVSRTGVTGARAALADSVAPLVARLRRHTKLPIAVGFGVSNPDHIAEIWRHADGAVIGSHLVEAIAEGEPETAPQRAAETLRCLVPA